MKLFAKLMIAGLIIAILLPFTILKGRDGNTLMSISDIGLPDFSMPSLPSFPSSSKTPDASEFATSDEDLSGKDLFYKWYDAEGNIQFTTEPPAEGIEYTVKGFDPDANVIQAVKVAPKEPAQEESGPTGNKTTKPEDIGNPYSKDSIEKLFKDAKNLEKILNQRLQDQQSTLNQ